MIHQHMEMSDHNGKICSKAFYSLYNLRQIRKCLTVEACKTLVHALVTCHLDYCNALLHDVSQYQQQRLQLLGWYAVYQSIITYMYHQCLKTFTG